MASPGKESPKQLPGHFPNQSRGFFYGPKGLHFGWFRFQYRVWLVCFRGFSMELGFTLEEICQQGAADNPLFWNKERGFSFVDGAHSQSSLLQSLWFGAPSHAPAFSFSQIFQGISSSHGPTSTKNFRRNWRHKAGLHSELRHSKNAWRQKGNSSGLFLFACIHKVFRPTSSRVIREKFA